MVSAKNLIRFGIAYSLLILIGCTNQPKVETEAQKDFKTVLDSFYALDSKLSVGISYINYSQEVVNLKVGIDKIERTSPKSQVLTNLKQSFEKYIDAKEIWKYCNESCWILDTKREMIPLSSKNEGLDKLILKLLNVYKPPTVFGGLLAFDGDDTRTDFKYTSLNLALSTIWDSARLNIKDAELAVNN